MTHYAANSQVIGETQIKSFADVTDGTSNTIFQGSAAGSYQPWGHPATWRSFNNGINKSADGFGGPFTGGMNVGMVDGSVRFLSETIDPKVLQALASPASGDEISNEF